MWGTAQHVPDTGLRPKIPGFLYGEFLGKGIPSSFGFPRIWEPTVQICPLPDVASPHQWVDDSGRQTLPTRVRLGFLWLWTTCSGLDRVKDSPELEPQKSTALQRHFEDLSYTTWCKQQHSDQAVHFRSQSVIPASCINSSEICCSCHAFAWVPASLWVYLWTRDTLPITSLFRELATDW